MEDVFVESAKMKLSFKIEPYRLSLLHPKFIVDISSNFKHISVLLLVSLIF